MKKILYFSLMLILLVSASKSGFSRVFYDIFDTFENVLKESDLIIIGKVKDSYTKRIVI